MCSRTRRACEPFVGVYQYRVKARAIGPGLMILLGVKDTDSLDIVPKLADKCAGLRIFPDAEGKLNLSARDLGRRSW